MKRFFSFPNPVNDAAARTVAIGVVTMALVALVTNTAWLLIPLTYGFVARVAAGPKISPLGQFAVRIAAPRLTRFQKSVPGPPKRFAQAIGLAFTGAATIVWLSAGWGDALDLDSSDTGGLTGRVLGLLPRMHGLWLAYAPGRHSRKDLRRMRGPVASLRHSHQQSVVRII
jgi:hypothetical protein